MPPPLWLYASNRSMLIGTLLLPDQHLFYSTCLYGILSLANGVLQRRKEGNMDKTRVLTGQYVPASFHCSAKREVRNHIHDRTSFRACPPLQGLGWLSAPSRQGSGP